MDIEKYDLLPSFWHGMTPQEKKKAVTIIDKHGGEYNLDCIQELVRDVSIPIKDLQSLCLCYDLAKEHPSHLDMGIPSQNWIKTAQKNPELEAVEAKIKPITSGLDSYLLHPTKEMTNEERFFAHGGLLKARSRIKEGGSGRAVCISGCRDDGCTAIDCCPDGG